MSMQATKRESHWISVPITQGGTEDDWIEQQPIIEGTVGSATKRTGTSATQLVCLDEEVSDGERFVVRQDADVYEGVADVTSFRDVEVDRIYGFYGASYDSVSFSVGSQESQPYGLAFSTDGTKMFVVGTSSDTVHQYTLSTAWNVGTASYDNVSFSIASQESSSYGLAFSTDGTKMFVVGTSSDTVHQYTLLTAWNVGTASYDSVSFSVGSQESSSYGLAFSTDGTKMFVVGNDSDTVHQYTLSIAWNVGTASYDSVSFSVGSQEHAPTDLAFSTDGTKMFVVGTSSDRVYQYTLSIAWNVGTASYASSSIASQESQPYGLAFSTDGTKMFVVGTSSDTVHQYTIPDDTVFYKQENTIDLTDFGLSASPQYVFTQVPDVRVCLEDTAPRCISRDTPMYLYGVGTDQAQVVYNGTLDQVLEAGDLVVVDEGDVEVTSVVDTGTTTPPAEYDNVFTTFSTYGSEKQLTFNNDGTKAYVVGTNYAGDPVYVIQYSLSSAYDLSSKTLEAQSIDIKDIEHNPRALQLSDDGKKLFYTGFYSKKIHEFILLTPWDVSTMYYSYNFFDFSVRLSSITGAYIGKNGTKMYMVNDSSNDERIYQYTLATAWDVTTASYDGIRLSISNTSPTDVKFDETGTRMLLLGFYDNIIREYTLTTPWNINSGSIAGTYTYGTTTTGGASSQFALNGEGTKVYIERSGYYQFSLFSPYSLGGDKIWNVNFPYNIIPSFIYIKDRSDLMPYTKSPISGTVNQYVVSLSTSGTIAHTFESQSFETTPKRAIQLSTIAGNNTTVTTLRANLWKAGTPTL